MSEPARPVPAAQDRFDDLEPRSGIDYALRTVQQSQVQFSLMADTKANIMITVCSIVISVALTQLDQPRAQLPLLILSGFTVVSLVAALLCVLPSRRLPAMKDGKADISSAGFNPLFFLHFQHVSRDEYEAEMERRLQDKGELYRMLVQDIYYGGVALAQTKFRLLRVSYLSFMVGLIAASAALGLSILPS